MFLGVPWAADTHHMHDLLTGHSKRNLQRPFVPAAACVIPAVRPGLDLIGSDARQVHAEYTISADPNNGRILAKRLGELADSYDLVILDAPPGVSRTSEMVLTAAHTALVPVAPGAASLSGLNELGARVAALEEAYGRAPGVTPVATFVDARERISKDLVRRLGEHAPSVRKSVRLAEAPEQGQSIFEYAPDSPGAADYRAVADFLETMWTSTRR